MTAAMRAVVEERIGQMSRRTHALHAVHVVAERRPRASDLAVQTVLHEVQIRGGALSWGEAEEIARRVLAAEAFGPLP